MIYEGVIMLDPNEVESAFQQMGLGTEEVENVSGI
jgi:hypothetical protein